MTWQYQRPWSGSQRECRGWCSVFFILLVQLPCSKYHVYCSMALTESTLTLWQQVLFEVLIQMVEQNPGQDFLYNGKQGDASLPISFPFVEVNNQNIFKFLWDFFWFHNVWYILWTSWWVVGYQLHIILLLGWSWNLQLCHWTFSWFLFALHLARDFSQGFVDWSLMQTGNYLIIDDKIVDWEHCESVLPSILEAFPCQWSVCSHQHFSVLMWNAQLQLAKSWVL